MRYEESNNYFTIGYGDYRWIEMIPGLLIWATFILAVLASFFAPVVAIIFIIVFDLYWLFRVAYFIFYMILSWKRYKRDSNRNWWQRVQPIPGRDRIHHFVFLPFVKEGVEIVRETVQAVADAEYPNDRIVIVLGGEERVSEHAKSVADQIKKEFGDTFKKIVFTEHPADLPDEIPGKGSNMNWMGCEVKKLIDNDLKIPYEDIVVTAFDVDTIMHKQYLSYLTYMYLTTDKPTRTSYQPVTLLTNNIWEAAAPVRISAFGTTFWLLSELARPNRLWTFSSHSMPWQMLVDVGFWQRNIVSEDSRIFLQGLITYHGDYKVEPMYIPVSMDTVTGKSYWDKMTALYKQQRRWAWGVEHLPILVKAFMTDKLIPRRLKFKYLFNQLEGMYTWATAPTLLFIMGWLPLWVVSGTSSSSALVQNAPFTLEWLMRLAMLGILVSATLSLGFLPRRPAKIKRHTWAVMLLQWLLLPITFTIFGALPAIDAQTRLMIGKYLGFNVTKKER
jgi:cellulose synthase/poly-beta-1,6-N-acetylglucosamine synthase-like glycosyltransferase